MPTIDAVMERVDLWRGRDPVATELSGGLTNANYVVTAGEDRYVVRIPGASTELLAVDRENERHNAAAAATTGVSPPILAYLDDWQVMVLPFIDGETMSPERLREPRMPARIAESLHRLHAAPRFTADFDMFRTVEYYLRIVEDHDVLVPDGYWDRLDTVAGLEPVLAVNALPHVPCHNDLLAENYIDDGSQLWIIDFEYSGNDDPCFELGDTAQECSFDDELRAALCQAYFGELDPVKLARMELYALMADVGWTLWAAIQSKISDIEFDFFGWAIERWDRAEAVIGGPRFAELQRAAAS
ncbi:MAG: phosphotransferase family protein [Actinomycetota bacterium]|nr:phosphotransferase family protein [Actinomycetota bacterium]